MKNCITIQLPGPTIVNCDRISCQNCYLCFTYEITSTCDWGKVIGAKINVLKQNTKINVMKIKDNKKQDNIDMWLGKRHWRKNKCCKRKQKELTTSKTARQSSKLWKIRWTFCLENFQIEMQLPMMPTMPMMEMRTPSVSHSKSSKVTWKQSWKCFEDESFG